MPNKKTKSNRVIHFEVQADDMKRAMDFYKKTFGWQIKQMMTEDKGGMDYWGIVTGPAEDPGINGGMYMRTPDRKIYTYDCTILVEDIDKTMENIMKNGGEIRQPKTEIPDIGYFAGGIDTEGNTFAVMQATG